VWRCWSDAAIASEILVPCSNPENCFFFWRTTDRKSVTNNRYRFPFMRAAYLRFCAHSDSVHIVAPMIHIFSTCRNDVLCPRWCVCLCASDKLPKTPLVCSLSYLYHRKNTQLFLVHVRALKAQKTNHPHVDNYLIVTQGHCFSSSSSR
jgi:hypothetical protein